LLIYTSLNVEL